MRLNTTYVFHLGTMTIIFDTCMCGKQPVSHVLAISDVRNRRTTPTCPCWSREVQLIRWSLKVISQARNRNHRRDRAIDYTSPRAVMFPADAGATRYCCALSKSASMHLGILALSTESSFLGKGGGGEKGGGQRRNSPRPGNRPLVHSTFWRTRESGHPKPRLIGHNN